MNLTDRIERASLPVPCQDRFEDHESNLTDRIESVTKHYFDRYRVPVKNLTDRIERLDLGKTKHQRLYHTVNLTDRIESLVMYRTASPNLVRS